MSELKSLMGISRITLVVGFVVFLLSSFMIIPDAYAVYSAELYPSQGSVDTEIFLKVRGIGGKLYLYWDGILLGTYSDGFYEDLPGFDIYFYPPNEHPLSDLGNHAVFLEFWWKYWDGQYYTVYWNTTLNFEITEYVPCPEYLALNSTYSALLADYSNLNASYSALQAQYNDLTNTYQELLADYNAKLANYSSLSGSYDSLCASYDALETNYNSLQSNNEELATSYGDLIGELTATRNLSYVFITTTIILTATTVYFAGRKPKVKIT